jgi:hypothetical protein
MKFCEQGPSISALSFNVGSIRGMTVSITVRNVELGLNILLCAIMLTIVALNGIILNFD